MSCSQFIFFLIALSVGHIARHNRVSLSMVEEEEQEEEDDWDDHDDDFWCLSSEHYVEHYDRKFVSDDDYGLGNPF